MAIVGIKGLTDLSMPKKNLWEVAKITKHGIAGLQLVRCSDNEEYGNNEKIKSSRITRNQKSENSDNDTSLSVNRIVITVDS